MIWLKQQGKEMKHLWLKHRTVSDKPPWLCKTCWRLEFTHAFAANHFHYNRGKNLRGAVRSIDHGMYSIFNYAPE